MLIAMSFRGVMWAARSRGCVVFSPLNTSDALDEHAQRIEVDALRIPAIRRYTNDKAVHAPRKTENNFHVSADGLGDFWPVVAVTT
jgi:hypothetical protein